MQMKYTEEKLNTFSKETLIQLFLTQQEQLSEIDGKLQLVLEQLAVMNRTRTVLEERRNRCLYQSSWHLQM